MKTLADNFQNFKSLEDVLDNPTISSENKRAVLTTAAGSNISSVFKDVLNLLFENRRETYIYSIALLYQTIYMKARNVLLAKLVVAGDEDVTASTESKIKKIVEKTNKTIDFVTVNNPNIIGGFILEIDNNWLFDASVKTQLNQLRNQLTKSIN